MLVRPFARMLRAEGSASTEIGVRLEALESSADRIPMAELQQVVANLAAVANDPTIGLRASLYTEIGDFEVLEWVAMSAATWRAANETACRYARVLNDASDYRFQVIGDKSHLVLGSTVPLHPTAADYQLAAYHLAIQLRVQQVPAELEVWFRRPPPEDQSRYQVVFAGAKLVFGAPFDGFVSDAWRLDTPVPTANPSLHRVLRAHADQLLAQSPSGDGLVERVSADILGALKDGDATAERTAARLGMARRTLTRQLAQSGTSFSSLLKEVRHRAAAHYLQHSDCTVEDIAFLLGFSECSPFVRAFQRWTGHSPLAYRKLHRGS